MKIVNGLTSQASQSMQLTLADGSLATLTLYFRPQQNGWFFDVEWPGANAFSCFGRRLVCSPNMLRQFRDVIPFGLACFSVGAADPMTLTCFEEGAATIVLLNPDDVSRVEAQAFLPP